MTDIKSVLEDRQKTHGDYQAHAQCTQGLMELMTSYANWGVLNDSQRESLHMVVHKIGRILTGDPNIADHWIDIAGYSQLVANQLENLPPGPGTPEDGGHHARYDEGYCRNCGEQLT